MVDIKLHVRMALIVGLVLGACSNNGASKTEPLTDAGTTTGGEAQDVLNIPEDVKTEDVQDSQTLDSTAEETDISEDIDEPNQDILDGEEDVQDTSDLEDTIIDNLDTNTPEDTSTPLDTVDDTQTEPGDTGLEPLPDTGGPPPELNWLLSIDNGTKMLQKVDIDTGKATNLCKLSSTSSYPSLTFNRMNQLYASRGGAFLDVIDPCTCKVTAVGSYGGWKGVNGITSDAGIGLFGVASIGVTTTPSELITVNTGSGMAETVGKLGVNFNTHGATWSDGVGQLFAISGLDDSLYLINPDTGIAELITKLNMDFYTVGIELHPINNVIYACSDEAILLSVDPETGEVTEIGPMGQSGSCTNLAAPWAPVPCLVN